MSDHSFSIFKLVKTHVPSFISFISCFFFVIVFLFFHFFFICFLFYWVFLVLYFVDFFFFCIIFWQRRYAQRKTMEEKKLSLERLKPSTHLSLYSPFTVDMTGTKEVSKFCLTLNTQITARVTCN